MANKFQAGIIHRVNVVHADDLTEHSFAFASKPAAESFHQRSLKLMETNGKYQSVKFIDGSKTA